MSEIGSSLAGARVRLARPSDLRHLATIEHTGTTLFAEHFGATTAPALLGPPPAGADRQLQGTLLVAELADRARGVVGFAHLVEVDTEAHLEQVSVLPEHGRAGIGSALVLAALEEAAWDGYRTMSLCTYRDVPWNGPWYRRLGFVELAEPGAELRRLRGHEQAAGLDECGPRVAMARPVR